MSDKPQSGAKSDPNRDRRWQAFMEYRKRVRTYAWLLTVGVPAAFLQWHEKFDAELAWLVGSTWSPAAVCAIVAQAALLVLVLQTINLLIEYRSPKYPKPEKRRRRADILEFIATRSVGVIILAEFWYFAGKICGGWPLFVFGTTWTVCCGAAYILAVGTEHTFTAVYVRKEERWVGYMEELPGRMACGGTLDEVRENLKNAGRHAVEANGEIARREAEGKDWLREEIELSTNEARCDA